MSRLRSEKPSFIKDDWLSECLGISCFSLSLSEKDKGIGLPEGKPFFVTAKLSPYDNVLRKQLLDEGFREINQQVTYQKQLEVTDLHVCHADSLPAGYRLEVQSSLATIKEFSGLFIYDRFSADDLLPRNWSEMIKAKWISTNDPKKRFIVAYSGDEVAGFILFKGDKEYVIDLVCLLERFRGKGLASAMLYRLQEIALNDGVYKLRVGTQKNNLHSISLYQKFGFVIETEKVVLHSFGGL